VPEIKEIKFSNSIQLGEYSKSSGKEDFWYK
jgi:hypothetical protein